MRLDDKCAGVHRRRALESGSPLSPPPSPPPYGTSLPPPVGVLAVAAATALSTSPSPPYGLAAAALPPSEGTTELCRSALWKF
jgi:hypothetical protein